MSGYYLGIDLGTSSVKGILRDPEGRTVKGRRAYVGCEPEAWTAAVAELIAELRGQIDGEIVAVGLSSQVGTYVVNGREVLSWRSDVGREELDEIKRLISEEKMIEAIGMPHPDLISYPLPRLLAISRRYGGDAEVLMPKELLIRALTGETVTDLFSMRGIAHPRRGSYATELLGRLGITLRLPALRRPTDRAGYVTEEAAKTFGIPVGTPIYLGCNDFFAGLLGMGVLDVGDFFDLSGTSEHIGYLSAEINRRGFVSGDYFTGCCTYGGTKASGASCDLAIRNFGLEGLRAEQMLAGKPPIFLPYLCGERAPIFDEHARGVYFGLDTATDRAALAYATLEGVVFSLYDIACSMEAPAPRRMICGGGSAGDALMNLLRATLFDCEVVCVAENDTSALGACMLAMVGDGALPDLRSAVKLCVSYLPGVKPQAAYRERLLQRFGVYRELYGALRNSFRTFHSIS